MTPLTRPAAICHARAGAARGVMHMLAVKEPARRVASMVLHAAMMALLLEVVVLVTQLRAGGSVGRLWPASYMYGRIKTDDLVVHCTNRSNCTRQLQAAFDADTAGVGNIVVAGSNGVVQVEPLFIRTGNRTITIAPGVELQAMEGSFHGVSDSLLSVLGVENLQLIVSGATLKMRKLDYLPPRYTKAEWRTTLLIRQSRNLTVVGGTCVLLNRMRITSHC